VTSRFGCAANSCVPITADGIGAPAGTAASSARLAASLASPVWPTTVRKASAAHVPLMEERLRVGRAERGQLLVVPSDGMPAPPM